MNKYIEQKFESQLLKAQDCGANKSSCDLRFCTLHIYFLLSGCIILLSSICNADDRAKNDGMLGIDKFRKEQEEMNEMFQKMKNDPSMGPIETFLYCIPLNASQMAANAGSYIAHPIDGTSSLILSGMEQHETNMKISSKYSLNPLAETVRGYTGTRSLSERLNRFEMEDEVVITGYYDSFDATMDISQWGVNNANVMLSSTVALKNLPSLVRNYNSRTRNNCQSLNSYSQQTLPSGTTIKLDPNHPSIRISQKEVKRSIVDAKLRMRPESLEPTIVKRSNGELLMVDGHHSYVAALESKLPKLSFKILTEDEFMALYGLAKEGMSFEDFLELFNLESKHGPCSIVEEFTPR